MQLRIVDCYSCTQERVSEDLLGEPREVDLADVKSEPYDVCCMLCCVSFYCNRKNLYRSLVADLVYITSRLCAGVTSVVYAPITHLPIYLLVRFQTENLGITQVTPQNTPGTLVSRYLRFCGNLNSHAQ